MSCIFCGASFEKEGRVKYHQRYCYSNPNKEIKSHRYKAGFVMPVEEKEKRSSKRSEQNKQPWSEVKKHNHREAMKLAVINNPESYSSGNRGRVKQLMYKGFKLHGRWELIFAEWCDLNRISWEKNTKYFYYNWNGERKYFPDFYLKDLGVYIEVKGYKTDRDDAKWKQFPEKLFVIQKQQIEEIKKNIFSAPW